MLHEACHPSQAQKDESFPGFRMQKQQRACFAHRASDQVLTCTRRSGLTLKLGPELRSPVPGIYKLDP